MSHLKAVRPTHPRELQSAVERAIDNLAALQHPEGYVSGEVVWCAMLAAQYVIVAHITGKPLSLDRRRLLRRYFARQQNQDGGFGIHDESRSYLYVTTLSYVALRLLGVGPDEPPATAARQWLSGHPVTAIPTWGKLWLAMLNLYSYSGIHPVQPEIWLLPDWTPIHPRRYYCHTRLIYMGFGYLYGVRFQAPLSPLIAQLRTELYGDDWPHIDWPSHRRSISANDLYVEPDWLLDTLYRAAGAAEPYIPAFIRRRALAQVLDRIRFEQRSSHFGGISPVNGMLNTLALFHSGDPDFDTSFDGIDYWIWSDEAEGLRLAGASSHTWDTAFAAQAIAEGSGRQHGAAVLDAMAQYFASAQIQTELPANFAHYYRLPSLGGWCFGDPHHHWPVSDCTAEALSALATITSMTPPAAISTERITQAVRFITLRHNADGGWGSYESQRGNKLLERINPAEMFGNCMSEYSYLECTSSCVQALCHVRTHFPHALTDDIAAQANRQISRGVAFILKAQRTDGSWPGFWGINYSYGTLFGVSGLLAAGTPNTHPAIRNACEWLLSHRLPDGGWGEHFQGCADGRYVPHEHSQVIQTAWAMMTLLRANYLNPRARQALHEAATLLLSRQNSDGSWDRESGTGIFFNTAVLHYDLYRNYFPLWALGLYARQIS